MYTTALDVYIIMYGAAASYLAAWAFSRNIAFLALVAVAIVIAIVSRALIIPHRRERHARLLDEQLNLIERRQLEHVQRRFREIVEQWRAARSADGFYA